MQVEIDQSGKVEQLDTHTVIACANGEEKAILITAATKRKVIATLRRSVVPRKHLIVILFSVLVVLLLKELATLPNQMVIDQEYTGKDQLIRETVRKLLNRSTRHKWKGVITGVTQ